MSWYLMVWKKFAEFQGRSRRSEYWFFFLFNTLAAIVLFIIGSIVHFLFILYPLYVLAAFIPGLAVSVRRLHDAGKSGFWFFIVLVPIAGPIYILYLMCQPSQTASNTYGSVPA